MRKTRLFKRLPTPHAIQQNRFLKPVARYLRHHSLWQFNRRAVAGGVAVGLFFGILIPFAQILFASVAAIILRVNLPVAAFSTLVTNPLTFPAIYYFAYKLGGVITASLRTVPQDLPEAGEAEQIIARQTDISGWLEHLIGWVHTVGLPLMTGLAVLAVAAATAGYFLVDSLWRAHTILRWRRRGGIPVLTPSTRVGRAEMTITKRIALGIGFLGLVVVALVDALITPRISLLLMHLIPVLFVTWFAGPRWGIFFAVAMTASQTITGASVNVATAPRYYWYLDIGSDFVATVLLVWMQSKLRDTFEQVNHLARNDALTGILNRNGFYEVLQGEIERKQRYGQPFSLVYFDCDNFKFVNDTHGHHVGDALLIKVAEILRSTLRRVDVPSRLGGDEFLVLSPESGADAVQKAVTHLKRSLDSAMQSNGWPVTFSIGVATFEQQPVSIDQAIEFADLLMYEVKKAGKDNVLFRSF